MKSERNHECVGFISRMQDRFNIQKSIIVIQKFKKKNYDYVSRNKTSWQNAMFVPKFLKKNLRRVGIEENFFRLIQGIYKNLQITSYLIMIDCILSS